jgi:hypothetical protein
MRVLGKLPNLAILRLLWSSFIDQELHLTFHREEFPRVVLHLDTAIHNLGSVEFEQAGAMPNLELLLFFSTLRRTRFHLWAIISPEPQGSCDQEWYLQ